jgi:5-methylcytosine-specific restriction endonuclease McrA
MENSERELVDTYKYNKETAREYIRSGGKCTYCGVDIFADWHQYATATIDHLLPKSAFPELAMAQDNLVLSCVACNHTKRAFNPLPKDETISDVHQYLASNRETLIARTKEYINSKVKATDEQRLRIAKLIYEP